ncbi:hypothetical protein GGR54DRAFT_611589 [Hypoxylon sp. NC1633]|nr:hypothetical protein GGR54DRAFT_611589 [Hypoxylon sp. NC1633]
MSAAQSRSQSNNSHHRRPQRQQKQHCSPPLRTQPTSSKPKRRNSTNASDQVEDEAEEEDDEWFTIRDIIDEKIERGKRYYLIDWDGSDKNGQPHKPSWEPKQNVTPVALKAWRDIKAAKHKQKTPAANTAAADKTPSAQSSSSRERGPPKNTNLRAESSGRKRSLNGAALHGSESVKEPAHKRQQTQNSSALSRSTVRDKEAGKASLEKLKPKDRPSGNQPTPRLSVLHAEQTQAPEFKEAEGDHRVIPDSQGVSTISASSQVQGDLVTTPGSSGHHPHTSSLSTAEIPSHQPDYHTPGNLVYLSTSTFKAGTNPHNSQGTTIEGVSTREDFSFTTISSTTRPNNSAIVPPREAPSGNAVSATSLSQDKLSDDIKTTSQQSNSQAAQIVAPLSSQQEDLVTQSQADLKVSDEDRLVTDTVAGKSRVQHDSQDSGHALSELNGNTRNTSPPRDDEPGSQPALSRVELSQSSPDKPSNSAEARSLPMASTSNHPLNPTLTTRQQAVPPDMDGPQPVTAPMSARERLRLIRERNFASLSDTSTPPALATDADQAGAQDDVPAASHANAQEAQAVEAPHVPVEAPPASAPLTPAAFLPDPIEVAQTQSEPLFDEQQSLVPETMQAPVEQDKQGDLILEESAHDEVGFGAQEDQPATLDPSALTLSIEHDMDISPPIPTDDAILPPSVLIPDDFGMPHDNKDETPPSYPKSLLPYVPTGVHEYLITLPFHNSIRPVYNDVIREYEEVVKQYATLFHVFPHESPQTTLVSKLDEMFSRLFDICDLPPFMETLPSMTPNEITKHVVGTNAKFAFVDELLVGLSDAESEKKVLILARPGKVMDLLGNVVETRGYRYILSGRDTTGPPTSQPCLTVVISSTMDKSSSIPEDVDVVIGFDHTYRPELLPLTVRERVPPILVLANTCSIQHLNMRISDNLELLERKNVLMLALVKAMRYVEDVDDSLIINKLHKAAGTFATYIQSPDDDFYWEPQEVPEDVFDDMHVATSQDPASKASSQGLGTDQVAGSRKRSHSDDDDETSSKRIRLSQPTVVTDVSHISNSLRDLIGDEPVTSSPQATLSVPVDKLETLAAKVKTLQAMLEESQKTEKQFRDLSDRSQRELDGHISTVNVLQSKYMAALKDRGVYEDEYNKAKEELKAAIDSLETAGEKNDDLEAENAELREKLSQAKESLLSSANPRVVKMAQLEKNLEDCKNKVKMLEKKVTLANSDMEFAKSRYQDASQSAAELGAERLVMQQRVEDLTRRADENVVKVNKIYAASETKELLRMLEEQKSIVRDRDAELGRLRDELRTLKESRRGTRQSSVPRSPRPSALGVVGSRNSARPKGGSSSRGTSPAPPPTGVFETGAGSSTPATNNRHSHLRYE